MAAKTIGGFPAGVSVSAYTRSSQSPSSLLSPPPPSGTPVETETAGSDGRVAFTALADGTVYVASDGTRTVSFATDDASGATAASPVETVNTVAAAGAAQTLPDVTTATVHRLTLNAATLTLTFPAAAAGKSFTVVLVQDATGGRLVTWPGTVKWAGGAAPVLTVTANKADVVSFLCADGTNWLGFVAGSTL